MSSCLGYSQRQNQPLLAQLGKVDMLVLVQELRFATPKITDGQIRICDFPINQDMNLWNPVELVRLNVRICNSKLWRLSGRVERRQTLTLERACQRKDWYSLFLSAAVLSYIWVENQDWTGTDKWEERLNRCGCELHILLLGHALLRIEGRVWLKRLSLMNEGDAMPIQLGWFMLVNWKWVIPKNQNTSFKEGWHLL